MGYVDASLGAQERVVWRGRQHWLKALAWPLWLLLGGIVLAAPTVGLSLLLLPLALLVAVPVVLGWTATELAVTDRRVVAKSGVLGRRVVELPLRQVESATVAQGAIARFGNYGDVVLSGTGGARLVLPAVGDPLRLRAAIQDQAAQQPPR